MGKHGKPKGRKCSEVLSSGKKCAAWATRSSIRTGKPFCFSHDPAQVEKRARARLKGGFRRRMKDLDWANLDFDLSSVKGIRQLLEHNLGSAVLLDNTTQRMTAITSLASTAIKLLEVTEMDQRITELEDLVLEYQEGQAEHVAQQAKFRRAA